MLAIIALLTFMSTAAMAVYVLRPRQNLLRRRIMEGASPDAIASERGLEGGPIQRLVWPSIQRFGNLLAGALPHNFVKGVEKQLIMANQPMPLAVFLFFWFVSTAGAVGLLFLAIRFSSDLSGLRVFALGAFLFLSGVMMPYGLLRRRARQRQRAIERAMPDALDLLLTSIEAGLGVDAAFALVAERSSGPIADIFTEYLRQVGLGRQRREALEDVAQRSGVDELIRLSAAVAQATEVGTTMGDVLRLQAQEMRASRRRRAQEAAQKAPVKMVIPIATCFLPAMAAVVIVPSILNLLEFVGSFGDGPIG